MLLALIAGTVCLGVAALFCKEPKRKLKLLFAFLSPFAVMCIFAGV